MSTRQTRYDEEFNGSAKDVCLTMTAFNKAYENRGCPQYVLFHSDRGSEYTASTMPAAKASSGR